MLCWVHRNRKLGHPAGHGHHVVTTSMAWDWTCGFVAGFLFSFSLMSCHLSTLHCLITATFSPNYPKRQRHIMTKNIREFGPKCWSCFLTSKDRLLWKCKQNIKPPAAIWAAFINHDNDDCISGFSMMVGMLFDTLFYSKITQNRGISHFLSNF